MFDPAMLSDGQKKMVLKLARGVVERAKQSKMAYDRCGDVEAFVASACADLDCEFAALVSSLVRPVLAGEKPEAWLDSWS